MKKIEWDFVKYNHKIYENHRKKCLKCQTEDEIYYCIVCGKHREDMFYMCYFCGDVVCGNCCPIDLSEHSHTVITEAYFDEQNEQD